MSHQMILTFDMDESKIQENAEEEAGRQIAKAVLKEVFGDSFIGSYQAKRNAENFITAELMQVLRENKDEIINRAIEEVVGSLSRTKIVRERLQEKLGEQE